MTPCGVIVVVHDERLRLTARENGLGHVGRADDHPAQVVSFEEVYLGLGDLVLNDEEAGLVGGDAVETGPGGARRRSQLPRTRYSAVRQRLSERRERRRGPAARCPGVRRRIRTPRYSNSRFRPTIIRMLAVYRQRLHGLEAVEEVDVEGLCVNLPGRVRPTGPRRVSGTLGRRIPSWAGAAEWAALKPILP